MNPIRTKIARQLLKRPVFRKIVRYIFSDFQGEMRESVRELDAPVSKTSAANRLLEEHLATMSDLATRNVRRLQARVAIVTGAGSGLGRAIALLFAREGARVVVADIDAQGGEETLRRITANGGSGVFARTDVTSEDALSRMVSYSLSEYSRIDILVNNAGINVEGSVSDLSPERWQHTLDVNLASVYRCCHAVLPRIVAVGGGSVINIASVQGISGFQGSGAYASSKGGVLALTRQLARDLAPHRVRVNAISPGVIITPIFDQTQNREAMFETVASFTPLGHLGVPEDIAFACLFLASQEASYITGINLVVDGGMTMRGV
jgi:NAD(P)-dependent dehydrogenase (short-subunit alcohol dehydrogenase family)